MENLTIDNNIKFSDAYLKIETDLDALKAYGYMQYCMMQEVTKIGCTGDDTEVYEAYLIERSIDETVNRIIEKLNDLE